jgi:hypothetical protein
VEVFSFAEWLIVPFQAVVGGSRGRYPSSVRFGIGFCEITSGRGGVFNRFTAGRARLHGRPAHPICLQALQRS